MEKEEKTTLTDEEIDELTKGISVNKEALKEHISNQLNEMALNRQDAMDICINLGEQFIEYFHKLYNSNDKNLNKHLADEMSNNFFKPVMKIIIKEKNKGLLDGELRDWFFTAGSNYETIIEAPTQDEVETYDKFVTNLINTKDVYTSLKAINLLNEPLKEEVKKNEKEILDFVEKFCKEHSLLMNELANKSDD